MKKQKRKYASRIVALSILIQCLLLAWISEPKQSLEESTVSRVTDTSIIDQYDMAMLVSQADLSVPTAQEKYSGFGFHFALQSLSTLQFGIKIKILMSLLDYVDLLFDIKELKFPSHFFW